MKEWHKNHSETTGVPQEAPTSPAEVIPQSTALLGICGVIEAKKAPLLIPKKVEVALGDVSALPDDLRAIDTIDWKAKYFKDTSELAPLPDNPDFIVRRFVNSTTNLTEEALIELAKQGADHLHRFSDDTGITVMPHRYTIREHSDQKGRPMLYAVTERLDGRPLLHDRPSEDREHKRTIVAAQADYLQREGMDEPGASILYDKGAVRQYTVVTKNTHDAGDEASDSPREDQLIMHDGGIEFSSLTTPDGRLTYGALQAIANLSYRASYIGMEDYPSLLALRAAVPRPNLG